MNNISKVLDGIKDKWKNIVLIVLSFLLISSIYNIFFIKNYFSKGLFPVCKSDLSIWR